LWAKQINAEYFIENKDANYKFYQNPFLVDVLGEKIDFGSDT